MDDAAQARFWAKVHGGADNQCWRWSAALSPEGYGRFGIPGVRKSALAHRVAYELVVGPVPDGMTLDHLCRTRACVNPAHLEPVTHRENMRRARGKSARARKQHCKRGHPLSGANLYPYSNRHCRACARLRAKRQRDRAREERTIS